jgi:hypothetical protein
MGRRHAMMRNDLVELGSLLHGDLRMSRERVITARPSRFDEPRVCFDAYDLELWRRATQELF